MSDNRGSFGSYEKPSYGSYSSGSSQQAGGGPMDFQRLSQLIGGNIQKMNGNVNNLQRMIGQIGTSQDNDSLRDRLHQVQHYTNQLAKETSKHLTDLAKLPPGLQSEIRQRKMQKDRLVSEFGSALNSFQAAQRQAAQKEKESVARARAHSAHSYSPTPSPPTRHRDPFMDDRKSDEHLVNLDSPTQSQQQVIKMEEDVDLQLLEERESSIRKLESDIQDVNQIFKDLGVLVHEQGEVIDSIESNVENAAVHVEQGTSELQKARTYQSKARRKKCIIAIIVVVILAIIALILGLTLKK